MRHGHWAPLIRRPSCFRRESRSNDLFVQTDSRRARTRLFIYGQAVDRCDEAGWKTRCDTLFQTFAARIDHHNAAVATAGYDFDELAECLEYLRKRFATRHHLQQLLLTGEPCFGPSSIVDVRMQQIPAGDVTL